MKYLTTYNLVQLNNYLLSAIYLFTIYLFICRSSWHCDPSTPSTNIYQHLKRTHRCTRAHTAWPGRPRGLSRSLSAIPGYRRGLQSCKRNSTCSPSTITWGCICQASSRWVQEGHSDIQFEISQWILGEGTIYQQNKNWYLRYSEVCKVTLKKGKGVPNISLHYYTAGLKTADLLLDQVPFAMSSAAAVFGVTGLECWGRGFQDQDMTTSLESRSTLESKLTYSLRSR